VDPAALKIYADELGPAVRAARTRGCGGDGAQLLWCTDRLGLEAKARRVVRVLASADGAKWLPFAPSPPAAPLAPPLLTPNTSLGDAPDLEFSAFLPFWYGDRMVGVVSNYAALPAPACAHASEAGTCARGKDQAGVAAAAGGVISQEWWVAANSRAGTVGTRAGWRRPYLRQTQFPGSTALAAPGGGARAWSHCRFALLLIHVIYQVR
jgi:hypothetical protein